MNNFEKIKQMSVDEMAEFLAFMADKNKKIIEQYLLQEVEE